MNLDKSEGTVCLEAGRKTLIMSDASLEGSSSCELSFFRAILRNHFSSVILMLTLVLSLLMP